MDSPDRKFIIELARLAVSELLAWIDEQFDRLVTAQAGEVDQRALDALEAAADGQWRSSLELAALAGYAYGGQWRQAMSRLVQAGKLERHRRTRKLRRPPGQRPDAMGTERD
jgi:hypothetical protein